MPDDRAVDDPAAALVLEGLPPYPFPNPTALELPPEWARLRAQCPVARIELASGDEGPATTTSGRCCRIPGSAASSTPTPPVSPTAKTRFAAHVVSDPVLRAPALSVTTSTPAMHRALQAVAAYAGDPTDPAILIRSAMARHAIIHTCAEREAELAEAGDHSGIPGWAETGDILVDGITALLTTSPRRTSDR